jgi:hypothetical protein
LIDGLVKAIFVYDDYIKLILTFDDKSINIPTSDEIEYMANSSDIQSSVSPKRKNHANRRGFFVLSTRVKSKKQNAKHFAGVRILRARRWELAHVSREQKYSP